MSRRNPSLVILSGLMLCLSSVFFISCGGKKKSSSGRTQTFRLPWQAADGGEYSLQNVELDTLTDPENLKGSAAIMLVAPEFHQKGGLQKGKPNFRFYKNGGVYIAGDTLSLQAATVYAHLERLQEIDDQVGVGKEVKRQRKVGIDSRWSVDGGKDRILVDNAIYDGRSDSMIIVPYESNDLPLALNAGVIAHEYSHGIFNALVRKDLKEEVGGFSPGGHFTDEEAAQKASDREKETVEVGEFNWEFAVRAADEGLADYWAWVYTGDDVFMGRSLSDHSDKRRLDAKPKKFQSVQVWVKSGNQAANQKKSLTSLAYRQGTEYARFLRELTARLGMAESREKRIEVAKRLPPALRLYARKISENFGQFISPDLLLRVYLEANKDLAEKHCVFFQQTLAEADSLQIEGCETP